MRVLATFLLIAIVVFLMYLREINQGMMTVNLLPSQSYELSKSAFFLISLAIAVLGSWYPTYRATRLDPASILQEC